MSSLPQPDYPRVETVDEQGNEFVENSQDGFSHELVVLSTLPYFKRRRVTTLHNRVNVASIIEPELEARISSRRHQIRSGLVDDNEANFKAGASLSSSSSSSVLDSNLLEGEPGTGEHGTVMSQKHRRSRAIDIAIVELDGALHELGWLSSAGQAGNPGLFDLLSTKSSSGMPRLALEKFCIDPTRRDDIPHHLLTPTLQLKRKQAQLVAASASLGFAAERLGARSSANQATASDLFTLKDRWRVVAPMATSASGRLLSAADKLFVDCSLETAGGAPVSSTNLVPLLPTTTATSNSSLALSSPLHSANTTTDSHCAFSIVAPSRAVYCTLELALEARPLAPPFSPRENSSPPSPSSWSSLLQDALGQSPRGGRNAGRDNSVSTSLLCIHEGVLAVELFQAAKAEVESAPDQRRLSRGAALATAFETTFAQANPAAVAGAASAQSSLSVSSDPSHALESSSSSFSSSSFSTFLSVLAVTDTMIEVEVDLRHILRLRLLPRGSPTGGGGGYSTKSGDRDKDARSLRGEQNSFADLLLLRAVNLLLEGWASDRDLASASSRVSGCSKQGGASTGSASSLPRPPPKAVVADSEEMHRQAFAKQYGGLKGPMQRKRVPDSKGKKNPAPAKGVATTTGAATAAKSKPSSSRVGVLRPLAAVARHELLLRDLRELCRVGKWTLDGPLGQPRWAPKASTYTISPPKNPNPSATFAPQAEDTRRHFQVGVNGESGRFEVDMSTWSHVHHASPLQMDSSELLGLFRSLLKAPSCPRHP